MRALARALKPGGVLVSYSSAYPYRGALLRAGLAVGGVGAVRAEARRNRRRLRPSLPPLPLPEKERGIILASTAGTPFRDPSLHGTREELFRRREALVARLRRRRRARSGSGNSPADGISARNRSS